MTVIWNNQSLVFTYYFPTYGTVFADSPLDFVADGSPYLSTLTAPSPATFSVGNVTPYEEQISYSYPTSGHNLTNTSFNGFTISGPAGDTPIVGVRVDAANAVAGLTSAALSFTSNAVTVNLAGDAFPAGAVALIDVDFAIPEPGGVVLFASGLLLVFAITRLRRRGPAWARGTVAPCSP